MLILNKEEALMYKHTILEKIKKGSVFIYPTDTIYGIGCNALNKNAVAKIRKLKKRPKQPFSIIAPSKEWILEKCFIREKHLHWLDKLPGKYTFILNLKDINAVAKNVTPGKNTLGVRIPDHWFTKLISELRVPIVTTSVNKSGEEYMISLKNLDSDIKKGVDYIFYEGEKRGSPSTIVDLTKDKPEIKER